MVRVEGLEQVTRFVERAHEALEKAATTREAKRVEDEGGALLHLARRLKLSEEAQIRLQTVIDAAQIRIAALDEKVKGSKGGRPSKTGAHVAPVSMKAEARAEAGVTGRKVRACREKADAAKADPEGFKAAQAKGKSNEHVRQHVKAKRRKARVEKIVEIAQGNAPLEAPPERFAIVYADPPWSYEHVETESRAIENQYPTMALDEICALPVSAVVTPDAVLFLWVPSPKLEEGLRVVREWGFAYRTCAVWVKDKIGMGYYFRQQHELLLVATRGNPPTPVPEMRPSSVIEAPRGEHSAKPPVVHDMIASMYPELPKVELFARGKREGWHVWGNQAQT